MRKRAGFTLVEILVGILLCSVLALAIAGVMVSGFKLWHRVGDSNVLNTQEMLEVEMISRDLRQSFRVKEIPLKGNITAIEFAGVENGELSKIVYSYDGETGRLFRQFQPYKEIIKNEQPVQARTLLKNVNVTFGYLSKSESLGLQWKDDFEEILSSPAAVKITIDSLGNKTEKVVFIPTTGN
jgi:type II secretory pathway component PulJ